MSDTTASSTDPRPDEAAGVGAADPVTGVTAGHDDLAADAELPDDDGDALEADPSGARGDHEAVQAESLSTVTNDAVAGETVYPGEGDGNDGPTGGAPGEVTPIEPENELDPASIDLDDER